MPANDANTLLPFSLPSLCGKKITAAFDGGTISSDGGVILLAGADKRLGLIERLAALIPDDRDPNQITHTMADLMRARVFAIACGYPDANDLDTLRSDPVFKLACGRLPESGIDLTSQPTVSRLENTLRANNDETSTPREFRPAGAEGSSRSCPCSPLRTMPRRAPPRMEAVGRRSWRRPPRHPPNYRAARAGGRSRHGTSCASLPRPTAPSRPVGLVRFCAAKASTPQPCVIGAANATPAPSTR